MIHNQKKVEQPSIIWRYSDKKDAPRILGINPWIYDFAAYNVWTRPTGLLCCLEMLGRAGACTALVDFMDKELDPDHWPGPRKNGQGHYPKTALPRPYVLKGVPRQFSRYGADKKRVRDVLTSIYPEPDLILVTSLMTYWYPGVISCIRLLKEIFPRTPVSLGGVYATLCYEHALNSGADLVISGPLERPDNWTKLWSLLGQGQVPIPEDSGLKPDTSYYARPDFSIIMTSRGCPFKCPYCASSKLYPRFRQAEPELVIEHVRQEYERGVRNFSFYDDALLVNSESVLYPLLEYIIDNDLVLRLHAPNALHIRYLSPKTCRFLKKAGLETIRLGLETTDFSNRVDSKLGPEEWHRGISNLLEAGFVRQDLVVYVLAGLPGQTKDELDISIRECLKMGLRPELNYYSPIPGTAMFEQARKYSDYPLEEPLWHNNSVWPCVKGGFSWDEQKYWKEKIKEGP